MQHFPEPAAPPSAQPIPPALGLWVQRVLAKRFDGALTEPVPEEMQRLLDLH